MAYDFDSCDMILAFFHSSIGGTWFQIIKKNIFLDRTFKNSDNPVLRNSQLQFYGGHLVIVH